MKSIQNIFLSLSISFLASSAFANLPPVAVNDQWFTYKNETVWSSVADNDSDPDGNTLTYSLTSPPNKGIWNLNSDGTYEYIPQPWTWGPVTMTYQVCDPGGLCTTASLTMYVIFINDPPVINPDLYYVPSSSVLQANVSDNDNEPDGELLFYSVFQQPDHGILSMGLHGAFTYTPIPGYQGSDFFIVNGCDPCQACFNTLVSITVGPPNNGPLAISQLAQGYEDEEVVGTLLGSDPDGDAYTFFVVVPPLSGQFSLLPTGEFSYTPELNWYGNASIDFEICDPFQACSQAVLTISILPVNDPPVSEDDFFSGAEDIPVNGSIALNDFDEDGDNLTYTLIALPASGSFQLELNGNFIFLPATDFNGSLEAVYQVMDLSGNAAEATLFIEIAPVNDAPMATNHEITIQKNGVFSGSIVFLTTDVDGDLQTFSIEMSPTSGNLTLQSNGSCIYTPEFNFWGTDQFQYRVTDPQGAFAIGTVTIQILYTDAAPLVAADFFDGLEDGIIIGNVGLNDLDPDLDPLEFTLLTSPPFGELSFELNGDFSYTPIADFHGLVSFQYKAEDTGGNAGQAWTVLLVLPVNDAPTCPNVTVQAYEDEDLTVLLNAQDIDGDDLEIIVMPLAEVGIWTLSTNEMSLEPDANLNGAFSFPYSAIDAEGLTCLANVYLVIEPVNDAPTSEGTVSFTILEDSGLEASIESYFLDLDSDQLIYSVVSAPVFGALTANQAGVFEYTPGINFHGEDWAVIKATDPLGLWAELALMMSILPVNDAPVSVGQAFSGYWNEDLSGQLSASDVDGDELTFSLILGPSNGQVTVQGNGAFIYSPDSFFFGEDSFLVEVCDSEICTSFVVEPDIFSENVAPVALNDLFTGTEDLAFTGDVGANDYDLNLQSLTFSLILAPQTGLIELNPNGSFTFSPSQDWNGQEVATYLVCDSDGLCSQANLYLTYSAVNDSPVISGAGMTSGGENSVLTGSVSSLATDVDDSNLTFSLLLTPTFGAFTLNSNGSFSYTPPAYFSGDMIAQWQVCDPSGTCASGELILNVLSVNHQPIANNEIMGGPEDGVITGNLLMNDYDPDGDAFTVVLVQPAQNGNLILNSQSGEFTFFPELNWHGQETITYTVCDSFGLCAEGNLILILTSINDTPVAQMDVFLMNHNQILTGNTSTNDSDSDGDVLTFSSPNEFENGILVMAPNGSFVFTPNPYFTGSAILPYLACDPMNSCDQGTILVSVFFSNEPPEVIDDNYQMGKNTVLSGDLSLNDSDPQNDDLSYTLNVGPASGLFELSADGTFTYTPDIQFIGFVNLSYEVCDPYDGCALGNATIEVIDTNSPPVFTAPETFACIDTEKQIDLKIFVLDYDTPVGLLEFQNAFSSLGMIQLTTDGILTFSAPAGYTGDITIGFEVCDDDQEFQMCTEAQFALTVSEYAGNVEIANIFINHPLCHGSADGAVELVPAGENYQLIWNGTASSFLQENLPADMYAVSIISLSSCLIAFEENILLTEPEMLTITGLEAIGIGTENGGSTQAIVAGGTAPYTFAWYDALGNNVSSNLILSGLNQADQAGMYSLTVADANGCMAEASILVTQVFEYSVAGDFKLYPNPCRAQVTISGTGFSGDQGYLTIFNTEGKSVITALVPESGVVVDVTTLTSGIYHAVLKVNNSDRIFKLAVE